MGYDFKVKNALRVRETREYPWPWKDDPTRTIQIFGTDTDYPDVLTVNAPANGGGGYMKHTGICCFGIQIPEEDLEPWPEEVVNLRLL
jgi:hypothetical protein